MNNINVGQKINLLFTHRCTDDIILVVNVSKIPRVMSCLFGTAPYDCVITVYNV